MVEISKDGKDFEPLTRFYRKDLYDRIMCGGSVAVIDTIREHCEELLKVEKENSWALVTVTECLRRCSPLQSHSLIMDNLERLATSIDPLRANMYRSLASHERIRDSLSKGQSGEKTILEGILEGEGRLSLRYLQLTELGYLDLLAPFVTELDVTGNGLKDARETALLPLLTHLTINENPIDCLPSLSGLPRLDFLSSASTGLSDPSAVAASLQQSSALKRFLYCETPLVDKTDELRQLVGDGIRLFPHYL